MRKKNGTKGITLVELTIALVIGLSVFAWFMASMVSPNLSKERVVKAGNNIAAIANGAFDWGAERGTGYAGISIQKLTDDGYIEPELGSGQNKNPWGGHYQIVTTTDSDYGFTISLTDLPTEACNRLKSKFADANCNGSTFSYSINPY